MSQNRLHIALFMMVKNEKKRILVSLESIKNFVDSIIIYDTGSTDNTIDIITDFCNKNNKILRLKTGEFVDFSTSRNEGLDFADSFKDIDYILLLDTNDELRGCDELRLICEKFRNEIDYNAFLVCQQWWSGEMDKYYNVRLIKAHKNWRYRNSVHEFITDCSRLPFEHEKPVYRIDNENIFIYQDRTKDDDKSSKRFHRDKILLLKDYDQDPSDPRTVFYLAQTYACLREHQESFFYYKLRSSMPGFEEERFQSLLRAGEELFKANGNWYDVLTLYIKAFEHSKRAEPLCKIVEYYVVVNFWEFAYMFVSLCCELKFPENSILFVDKGCYDYKRWHLLGVIGHNLGKIQEGKFGCLKALQSRPNSEIDKNLLKIYEDIETKNKLETKTNLKNKKK
jgi:glycosyltransferase involved in cell wall biosynthesis